MTKQNYLGSFLIFQQCFIKKYKDYTFEQFDKEFPKNNLLSLNYYNISDGILDYYSVVDIVAHNDYGLSNINNYFDEYLIDDIV
jgi:uncharacterized protein YbcV (DUF1398 family)